MNRTIDTKVLIGVGAIAALFTADVVSASLGPEHLSMAARHALTAFAATSSTLGLVLGGLATLVLAATLLWHRALSRAITPRKDAVPAARRYPSITVIRPVRGKDVGAEDNFRAALDTGYPGDVETLFVFDDDQDPGLPVARDVVAAHRAAGRAGTADVIVAGAPPAGMTGKLNAMVVGQRHAHGELVAFGDSDTRPDRDVLRGVVDKLLESPKNGSAFAPVLVHQPPKAAGDVLYAIMQNALYSPLAAWASGEARELPFIMGQLMVFRRSALSAIGGVESVQGQLVDDMAIGKRVYEAGYKNVMSRIPLHIATGGMTLAQFLPVFRRWMSFSRNGLPTSFVWRQWAQGAGFFASVATLATAVASGHLAAAGLALAALVAFSGSLFALQRRYGGAAIPLRFWWTPSAFFLISPVILVQNMMKRKVEWRGREYRLGKSDALVAAPAALPATGSAARRPTLQAVPRQAA